MKSNYTIQLNSTENIDIGKKSEDKNEQSLGPIAEKTCKKCGFNQMAYATVQLRSADEGQTVFYTCMKCRYFHNGVVILEFSFCFFELGGEL